MPPEHFTAKPGVEERLLASLYLIDAAQACALLRIETDDPEGAVQAMAREDGVIALVQKWQDHVAAVPVRPGERPCL